MIGDRPHGREILSSCLRDLLRCHDMRVNIGLAPSRTNLGLAFFAPVRDSGFIHLDVKLHPDMRTERVCLICTRLAACQPLGTRGQGKDLTVPVEANQTIVGTEPLLAEGRVGDLDAMPSDLFAAWVASYLTAERFTNELPALAMAN